MLDNERTGDRWFLGFASLGFVVVFLSLLALRHAAGDRLGQVAIYILFFSSIPIVTFAAAALYRQTRERLSSTGYRILETLGCYLPVSILLYGLIGIREALYHSKRSDIDPDGSGISDGRFLLGSLTTGLVVALWLLVYRKFQRYPKASDGFSDCIRFALLTIFIAALFNADLGYDSAHYGAYAGPASDVALGAVPLVDAFSQYGLNYLLLTACLKVLPWSVYSLSLFVSALNLVYYFVIALICIRVARDKSLAAILSVFFILFLISAAIYNPTYTPSVGAMRYLPPFILLLALCYMRDDSIFSLPASVALCLCSLWSAESLIFSAVIYSTYVVTMALRTKPFDLVVMVKRCLLLSAIALLPHLVIAAAYLAVFGAFPRYDIYLKLLSTKASASDWVESPDPTVRTWVIFGFSYALALAYALFSSWTGKAGHPRNYHAVIASTAALGVLELSYYAGRATTPVLMFLAFPLLIIFVLFVDGLVHSMTMTEPGKHSGWPDRVAAALVICMTMACGGVIADRFFRKPYAVRSNATLLRECLSTGESAHCWSGLRQIPDKLQRPGPFVPETSLEPILWQLIPAETTTDERTSSYALIRKWLPHQERVFLFIYDPAEVLLSLKKRNALGLSHPPVDIKVPALKQRAMQETERATEGTLIFVGPQLPQEMQEIYAHMKQQWNFQEIDSLDGVRVIRLQLKR